MRHRRGKPEKAKSSLWLAFDITHIEQTLEIINSFQVYTMGLYQNLTTAFLIYQTIETNGARLPGAPNRKAATFYLRGIELSLAFL